MADVAFVGGSLDGRRGGQNMIEPAAYGAAVVFGPHVWNFRDTAHRLLAEGAAIQIADAAALDRALRRLAQSPAEREQLGNAAQRFVIRQQGATQRTGVTRRANAGMPGAGSGVNATYCTYGSR